jgi:hypothetical protein
MAWRTQACCPFPFRPSAEAISSLDSATGRRTGQLGPAQRRRARKPYLGRPRVFAHLAAESRGAFHRREGAQCSATSVSLPLRP